MAAKKSFHNMRKITKADVDIGKLIRLRRTELKISQEDLGGKLGITFQQIQKYEKGVNRVGAARLQAIAIALDVPITFFHEVATKEQSEMHTLMFRDAPFCLRLLRATARR